MAKLSFTTSPTFTLKVAIPVPGKKAGEYVSFGGLFGGGPIMEVKNSGSSANFINRGGQIPAPARSLTN